MTKRVYDDYIQDIMDSISATEEFVASMSFDNFQEDKKTHYAVIRALEIIGEAAGNIPQEIKDKYSEVPWRQIIGMRNMIAHQYFGVDLKVVWQTVQEDIPSLKLYMSKLVSDLKKQD